MSHEVQTMAFVGELPWHGLGHKLPAGKSIEEWKKAAGLEWLIKRSPIKYSTPDKSITANVQEYPDFGVLYRSDNGAALSIVGNGYKIVQPGEVLEFYRDLVTAAGGFNLETAGVLKGGRKIWALARRKGELKVDGKDILLPYLLLATSCDGSLATTAKFTTVRVVCNNTLQMSIGARNESSIRVPHKREFDPKAVKKELGLIDDTFHEFEANVVKLAKCKVSQKDATRYFVELLAKDDEVKSFDKDGETSRTVKSLMELFTQGPGSTLKSANGTAWGLVNCVTRFYDHERNSRSLDNKLNSAWFGKGNRMKDRAMVSALKLVA